MLRADRSVLSGMQQSYIRYLTNYSNNFFLTETKIIELPNIILFTRTNNFFFFPHYLDRVATKLWNRICSKTSFSGPTSSSNIFFIRCTVTNFIIYRRFFCVQVPIWQYAFASQVRFKFTNVNLCAYCYLKRSEIRLLFFLTIVYYTIILYKIINYTRLSIFQNLLCLIIITITIQLINVVELKNQIKIKLVK